VIIRPVAQQDTISCLLSLTMIYKTKEMYSRAGRLKSESPDPGPELGGELIEENEILGHLYIVSGQKSVTVRGPNGCPADLILTTSCSLKSSPQRAARYDFG
jgi:hypothetical protein